MDSYTYFNMLINSARNVPSNKLIRQILKNNDSLFGISWPLQFQHLWLGSHTSEWLPYHVLCIQLEFKSTCTIAIECYLVIYSLYKYKITKYIS